MAVEQEVTYYDDYVVVSEVVERGVKKVTKRGTCTVTDKDVQWGGGGDSGCAHRVCAPFVL